MSAEDMSAEVGTKEHPMEVQRVGYDGSLGVWGERFGESDVSFVVWKEEKGLSKPIDHPQPRPG